VRRIRGLAIAIAVIVVAVAIILASGILTPKSTEQFGNDEWRANFTPWNGDYKVGDFLKYSYQKSYLESPSEYGTSRREVIELSDQLMSCNITDISHVNGHTDTNYAGDSDYEWQSDTVAFSMGFLALVNSFDTDPDIYNSIRITFLGVDNITTKWGVLHCDHFRCESSGSSAYEEEWVYMGIAIREILSWPNVTSSNAVTYEQYDLIDSNFTELAG